MRRRVVVTGIGAVTPVGNDVESMWKVLREGGSGIGRITHFDASRFPTKIAAEVKNFDLSKYVDDPSRYAWCGCNITFAIAAATEAVHGSGILDARLDPSRFGIYLGAGEGHQDFPVFMRLVSESRQGDGIDLERFTQVGLKLLNPQFEIEQEPNMPAGHLAALFNAQGPNLNCLTACAASSQAIGEATEIIRRGDADVMLSGGAHSMIHAFGVTGFNLLTALSTRNDEPTRASRPFDKNRDGFVLGEGAGIVVLESLEHARARGAQPLAELVGYGATADASHITLPAPGGAGAVRAVRRALQKAGIGPDEVQLLNAHATSTPEGDKTEIDAVRTLFGEHAPDVSVTANKSMLGHTLGAAGAIEAIATIMSIRTGCVPPTVNLDDPEPAAAGLDLTPNVARYRPIDVAVSNSFGFGGQNSALVFRRWQG